MMRLHIMQTEKPPPHTHVTHSATTPNMYKPAYGLQTQRTLLWGFLAGQADIMTSIPTII